MIEKRRRILATARAGVRGAGRREHDDVPPRRRIGERQPRVRREALRDHDQEVVAAVARRRLQEGAERTKARVAAEVLGEEEREETGLRRRAADPGRDDAANAGEADRGRRLGPTRGRPQQCRQRAHAGLELGVRDAPGHHATVSARAAPSGTPAAASAAVGSSPGACSETSTSGIATRPATW